MLLCYVHVTITLRVVAVLVKFLIQAAYTYRNAVHRFLL